MICQAFNFVKNLDLEKKISLLTNQRFCHKARLDGNIGLFFLTGSRNNNNRNNGNREKKWHEPHYVGKTTCLLGQIATLRHITSLFFFWYVLCCTYFVTYTCIHFWLLLPADWNANNFCGIISSFSFRFSLFFWGGRGSVDAYWKADISVFFTRGL